MVVMEEEEEERRERERRNQASETLLQAQTGRADRQRGRQARSFVPSLGAPPLLLTIGAVRGRCSLPEG
jgi:hypothetical protein